MREILFRGKRTDNGEWVFGYYEKYNGGSYINLQTDRLNSGGYPIREFIEVIPESISEFSGLTDKNGQKIFEGDIVHCITFSFERDEFTTEIKFGARSGVQGFYLANGRMMFHFGQKDLTRMDDIEIIGNIHDNSELLGGDDTFDILPKYCQECGAKMDGKEKEDVD